MIKIALFREKYARKYARTCMQKNRPELPERLSELIWYVECVHTNSHDVTIGRDGPVPVSLRYVGVMMLEWPVK